MSFYRTILAVIAAVAIATPVFADDTATTTTTTDGATTTTQTETATPAATDMQSDAKVNLNKATAKDLMKVKGLNASKARAIVAYRKKHGDFKSTDDLMNVKGFKKMNADDMKSVADQLTVE